MEVSHDHFKLPFRDNRAGTKPRAWVSTVVISSKILWGLLFNSQRAGSENSKTFWNTHSACLCFLNASTTTAFVHFPNLPSDSFCLTLKIWDQKWCLNKTPSEPGLTCRHRKHPVYLLHNNTFNSFSQSWELKQNNNNKKNMRYVLKNTWRLIVR